MSPSRHRIRISLADTTVCSRDVLTPTPNGGCGCSRRHRCETYVHRKARAAGSCSYAVCTAPRPAYSRETFSSTSDDGWGASGSSEPWSEIQRGQRKAATCTSASPPREVTIHAVAVVHVEPVHSFYRKDHTVAHCVDNAFQTSRAPIRGRLEAYAKSVFLPSIRFLRYTTSPQYFLYVMIEWTRCVSDITRVDV